MTKNYDFKKKIVNFLATKYLIDSMIDVGVPNLVYVSDAYANLPVADNFGISEKMHLGEVNSYLLGEYGASRTQAELYARKNIGKLMPNGKKNF